MNGASLSRALVYILVLFFSVGCRSSMTLQPEGSLMNEGPGENEPENALSCASFKRPNEPTDKTPYQQMMDTWELEYHQMSEAQQIHAIAVIWKCAEIREPEDILFCEKVAANGVPEAQQGLAILYREGVDVEKDLNKAFRWMKSAAEQELRLAQYNLGTHYARGEGVETSPTQALHWFRRAANNGLIHAQLQLGNMYLYGMDIQRSPVEAVKWYREAAWNNDPVGQRRMGLLCQHGIGVERDETAALQWFKLSSSNGDADASFQLGLAFESGSTVPRDLEAARKWFALAVEQGHEEAEVYLEWLEVSIELMRELSSIRGERG